MEVMLMINWRSPVSAAAAFKCGIASAAGIEGARHVQIHHVV
jgi:hypothetical protein